MTTKNFRIAYIGPAMYPSFNEVIDNTAGLELVEIDPYNTGEAQRTLLASCHGYYVHASRDELSYAWHVTPSLLAAMPSLVVVASYGAGVDTIDIPAFTVAGVAAVNQAGGNAQASPSTPSG